MNPVAAYIRERRKALGLPASEVARRAGVSGEHILYIEKEERKAPSFDVVMRIIRALRADPLEFLQTIGYLSADAEPVPFKTMRRVPIISWAAAGNWRRDGASDHHANNGEWIEADMEDKKVFALRVKDVSMKPEFVEGDVIIINPQIEAVPRDFVIAKNGEEEAIFRQLRKYGRTIALLPFNPKYPEIVLKRGHRYRIIGKVIKKEKKY